MDDFEGFKTSENKVTVNVKSLQSCPTLWNPTDCSPPGSFVHGILQARILEWVSMPSSRGSSQPRDRTCVSWGSCTAGDSLPLSHWRSPCRLVEIAREPELEVEPNNVTPFLQSHHKTLMHKGVASYGWAKTVTPWDEIYSCKDAAKIIEMSTKDLEYYESLVNKAVTGFDRIDLHFESSTVGQMLSQQHCMAREKLFMKGRVNPRSRLNCPYFKKTAIITPTFSNHHLEQSAAINIKARPFSSKEIMTLWRLKWMVSIFKQ